MKNRIGSNQYQSKYKYKFYTPMAIILLLCLITAIVGHYSVSNAEILSPLAKTQPTPTPIVIQVAYEGQIGDPVIDEISKVFKNEGKATVVKAINCFYSESKLNTLAYNFNTNGTSDAGVAQINDVHGMSIEDRQDYKKNIKKAYKIFKKRGWSAWYAPACK